MNTLNSRFTLLRRVVVLLALGLSAPAFAGVTDWTFEQARLGMGFRTFVGNTRFEPPCDMDPINNNTRSVILFTAKPCRGITFPEGTSVILFTASPLTDANLEVPVNTIAWMGGTYFDRRTDFPVRIGVTVAEAEKALGREMESVTTTQNGTTLRITRHAQDIFSMSVGGRTVGYVIGEMPRLEIEEEFSNLEADEREEWNGVVAIYFRMTLGAPVTNPGNPGNPGNPTNPVDPGNPGEPTPPQPQPQPQPDVDPVAVALINEFFRGLKITHNENERFVTVAATLHRSLLRKDGRDFAPGIREYNYRRAIQHVGWYADPVEVERVQVGSPTVIGAGPDAERGRVNRIFVKPSREYSGKSSAPIHVFYPSNGDDPSILNFGSL